MQTCSTASVTALSFSSVSGVHRIRLVAPDEPRYYSARDYEATIRRLCALGHELVLTAHYDVMERDAAGAFLDRSLAFVQAVSEAVRAGAIPELWPLTQAVDAAVGPFPSFTHELAASVRAHLAEV
jgi:hypothetical protein